ncbi:HutD/Ves family protein [Affinirhizobium pseudoryzae]|uniref:HutD/Ves family protein n=1 Tax=Allorhizobium pseudoryzae TaxID=379684 RepID=UPI0013EB35E5|nr:HutD family protein [Allorhizobium pseudoryzae]
MKILKAKDHTRMPWKNGGGETAEIAVYPPGAGLDSFGWRISMATVSSDGPFSTFAGVDRTLTILSGDGMELAFDGQAPVKLDPHSAPLAFPADVATVARLTDGTVIDLNVMTRRGAFTHRVERLSLPHIGRRNEATEFLFCGAGNLSLETEAGRFDLKTFDCAAIPAESTVLSVSGHGVSLMIEIHQADATP